MGTVIAFTNSKGGVGKSTLSVHLAAKLAEAGKSVVLVDADVQGSSSQWLTQASPEACRRRLQTPDDILDQIPTLREQYRYVIIDGPAGLSEVTRAVLLVANLTFLPCGPSALDLWAASEAIRVVRQVQGILNGMPTAVLVPNKLQARYRLSREMVETATNAFSLPVVGGLRLRQAYADAAGQGTVVWRLKGPSSTAAEEMNSLLEEMMSYERKEITDPVVANG